MCGDLYLRTPVLSPSSLLCVQNNSWKELRAPAAGQCGAGRAWGAAALLVWVSEQRARTASAN